MFNPDILFRCLRASSGGSARCGFVERRAGAESRQRWKRERIEDDDGRVGGGSGGRLRDILLEVEEEEKKG